MTDKEEHRTKKALEYIKDIGSYSKEELIKKLAELRATRSIRPVKEQRRQAKKRNSKLDGLPPEFRKQMEKAGLL